MWDLVLFISSRRTQRYNRYLKRRSYEEDKTFLRTSLIKKKDMQKEGWTDTREMEAMKAWAACITGRRRAAVRRAVADRRDRSPDKLFHLFKDGFLSISSEEAKNILEFLVSHLSLTLCYCLGQNGLTAWAEDNLIYLCDR